MHHEPTPEVASTKSETEDRTTQERIIAGSTRGASRNAAVLELEAAQNNSAPAAQAPRSAALGLARNEEMELGLFLVRPTAASAAKALSSFRVELNPASKGAQIARLREFRNDTRHLAHEAGRWMLERRGADLMQETEGLISAGFVVALSQEEAATLRCEVRDIQVIENRVLPIISPLRRTVSSAKGNTTSPWHLDIIGQTMARRNGHAFSGRGVHVAILDTGVDLDHPELGGRVTDGWCIDKSNPSFDATAIIADANHHDTDGHGTHVAGLILGKNVGVAPDATASSVTMMPRGYATTFDFIRCLDWAAADPRISLINFSAGESPYKGDMIPFIADLLRVGVLSFIAVGNDGRNTHCSPGDYALGVSVGSVDPPTDGEAPSDCRVSGFSGSAKMTVDHMTYEVPDLVAPGGGIHSSYTGGTYAELDGTSMATPIACGVAACLIERAGGILSPAELEDELFATCIQVQSPPSRQGRGLIQVP